MQNEHFRRFVELLMDHDATPSLSVPDDFDLENYKKTVVERFANSALKHRTWQVAMDGSQKVSFFFFSFFTFRSPPPPFCLLSNFTSNLEFWS